MSILLTYLIEISRNSFGRACRSVDEAFGGGNRERSVDKREVPTRCLPLSDRVGVEFLVVCRSRSESSIRSFDRQFLGGFDTVFGLEIADARAQLRDLPHQFVGRNVREDICCLLDDE
jgi:hypothetical protein